MHQSGPPYLPMFESVFAVLANGKKVKVTDLDRRVAQKIKETENTLQRKDRRGWALRFFKKALIEQLLWMTKYDRKYFKKKFKSFPAKEQPELQRQLQELADVDITPFQEIDPDSPEAVVESPYCAWSVIDDINKRLNHYLQLAEKYKGHPAAKAINSLEFKQQTFGEIVSLFRRSEIEINRSGK